MIEKDNFESYKTKLENTCEENSLIAVFKPKQYPITLIIHPDTSSDAQLSLLEDGERPNPKGSEIRFIFRDGKVSHRATGGIEIGDALFNKLRNLFKSLHYAWLQVFFLETLQRRGYSDVVNDTDNITEDNNFEEILDVCEDPDAADLAEEPPEEAIGEDPGAAQAEAHSEE